MIMSTHYPVTETVEFGLEGSGPRRHRAALLSTVLAASRSLIRSINQSNTSNLLIKGLVLAIAISAAATARASLVTTTITGTVSSGSDVTGVFGLPAGTDLTNQPFTLTYTFDDTKGVQGCITNGVAAFPDCISQISSTPMSNPGTAVLVIAGKSYTFGTQGVDADLYGYYLPSFELLGQEGTFNYLYYYVVDAVGSGADIIAGIVFPQTGSAFPISSWEGSFSASNTQSAAFEFEIATNNGEASGALLPTSVSASGPAAYAQPGAFVAANQPWTNTGVSVTAGQQLQITATGQLDYNSSTCPSGSTCTVGPDGSSPGVPCTGQAVTAPNLPCNSLIARIGDGDPFEVGSNFSTTSAAATGELFLGPNDSNFDDNTLGWTVTITTGQSIAAGTALQFVPITPCRVADTRGAAGEFGGPEIAAGSARSFAVPQSACGIPPNAVAYSLNVTALPDAVLDYLTLWPAGLPQPNVSTLNSDGRIKANAAITPAGANGGVNLYVSDASNVILDIDGYFAPAGTATALAFYPVTPCRVADTRGATSPLGGPFLSGGSSREFPLQSSACGLPSNAQAYSLNVTSLPHGRLNYLTSWPSGQSQPNVSTLNSPTGAVAANAAIVPAGSGGDISVFVSDDADVILDVNGYFAPPAAGGLALYTATPCRVLDTRSGVGVLNGVLGIDVIGSACAPPSTAQAYIVNATVVPAGPLSYVTLWPDGESQPDVSTLNAGDGAVTSNLAIVPTTNGIVRAFSSDATQLIVDLSSYFAP